MECGGGGGGGGVLHLVQCLLNANSLPSRKNFPKLIVSLIGMGV